MSQQNRAGSTRLMIVETGKRERKRDPGSTTTSSPPNFERQIVGRHVIYKSPDGSKLRSMAEARRYFKQNGHTFVESDFDFTPPSQGKNETPLPAAATPVTSPGKMPRGRPKTAVLSTSKRSPKSGKARQKELADDVKTIRDALTDHHDAPGTKPSASGSPSKGRRGRPSKASAGARQQSQEVDNSQAKLEQDETVNNSSMTSDSADGNAARPIRQRKPNQRYTDLISESEVSAKKRRSSHTGASAGPESFVTYGSAKSTSQSKKSLPRVALNLSDSKSAGVGFLNLVQKSVQRKGNKQIGVKRGRPVGSRTMKGNGVNKPKFMQGGVQVVANELDSTVELYEAVGRDVSVSPIAHGEFEAPPEFVEIQQPVTPQDEQLPPVMPIGPVSSSMLPATSSYYDQPADTCVRVIEEPVAKSPPGRSPESPMRAAALSPVFMSSATSVQPAESFIGQGIDMHVKRGRKPANPGLGSMLAAQRSFRTTLDDFGSSRKPSSIFGWNHRAGSSIRQDQSVKMNKTMECGRTPVQSSPTVVDGDSGAGDSAVRGLAKLQQIEARKITIGRFGATSAAAAVNTMPELEPEEVGYADLVMTTKQQQQQQRANRQGDPPNPALFCFLPPEVASDHCYGRQINAPSDNAGPPAKPMHSGTNAGPKHRRSHHLGVPPVLEPAEPYGERRMQRRSDQRYFHRVHHMRTPSPPPYKPRRQYYDGNFHTSHVAGHHQGNMLTDKLPANILEEDDRDMA